MGIENPYRSQESHDKRTPGKPKVSGSLCACSRQFFIVMLLFCASLIMLMHVVVYNGNEEGKLKYKEALKRLRGTPRWDIEGKGCRSCISSREKRCWL